MKFGFIGMSARAGLVAVVLGASTSCGGGADAIAPRGPLPDERPAACGPVSAGVIGSEGRSVVIATPAATEATARTLGLVGAMHDGPVVLASIGETPPVEVLASANLGGAGPNRLYKESNAGLQERCFDFDARAALDNLAADGTGDVFAAIGSALAAGHDAGTGGVTVVVTGFAHHKGSGVDMGTADLGTDDARRAFVRAHVDAGLFRPLTDEEKLSFLSPGEGRQGARGADLHATAEVVCEVLDPAFEQRCNVGEELKL